MMQGKSLLNPYATPYVPLSKVIAGVSFERGNKATQEILGDAENKEVIEKSADYQLADSDSVDYDVQHLGNLEASNESSRKIGDPWNSDDTFQDVIPLSKKQSVMDDPNLIMDLLSSLFPNISIESLAELLNANHGDLNQTIDVLEQLEYEGDEVENSAETSETSNSLDDPSGRANASGISSSI
ncbi:polyadenylate-binding protein-interacting protein 6 [Phoenix dactylifera]|uniref:Polyadenylate-binding protein-interacting protein 6 n=1 Tax=Phoenix dactylifera TaxID=42345 RepID=A0A8B7CUC7_PHODC|nr:polyadenylate-binding protein-interacting protein 6 [Phoenix dactylifera]